MITDGSFESTSTTWRSRFGTSTTYSPVSGNAYMGSKSLSIPADGNAAASSFTAELGVYYTFSPAANAEKGCKKTCFPGHFTLLVRMKDFFSP